MKTIAYVVAGLAALGIMVALIANPSLNTQSTEPAVASASLVSQSSEPATEPGSMTLEVPGMHCQFACYPKVKKSLEESAGVTEVALVEQPEPNTLTVKQVIVKYDAGFDLNKALLGLKEDGYAEATKVQ